MLYVNMASLKGAPANRGGFLPVSIWVFCFTLRAGALSYLDDAPVEPVDDHTPRGQAPLNTQDEPDTLSGLQQPARKSRTQNDGQGMVSSPHLLQGT